MAVPRLPGTRWKCGQLWTFACIHLCNTSGFVCRSVRVRTGGSGRGTPDTASTAGRGTPEGGSRAAVGETPRQCVSRFLPGRCSHSVSRLLLSLAVLATWCSMEIASCGLLKLGLSYQHSQSCPCARALASACVCHDCAVRPDRRHSPMSGKDRRRQLPQDGPTSVRYRWEERHRRS